VKPKWIQINHQFLEQRFLKVFSSTPLTLVIVTTRGSPNQKAEKHLIGHCPAFQQYVAATHAPPCERFTPPPNLRTQVLQTRKRLCFLDLTKHPPISKSCCFVTKFQQTPHFVTGHPITKPILILGLSGMQLLQYFAISAWGHDFYGLSILQKQTRFPDAPSSVLTKPAKGVLKSRTPNERFNFLYTGLRCVTI